MKKKTGTKKLLLGKKVITPLNDKQAQAVAGGVNSLEWKTRCCCEQQRLL